MTRRVITAVLLTSWLALSVGVSPAQAKNAPAAVTLTVNEPVQATGGALLSPTSIAANAVIYVVPAGKRLVVEHFSSEVGVAATTILNRFLLGIAPNPSAPGGVRFSHFIAPSFSAPCGTCAAGQVEFVGSQPIRMYVDAGEALVANVTFSDAVGPDAFGFFAASGYLIDKP